MKRRKHHAIGVSDFLHIQVASVHAVVDGQGAAGDRRDADYRFGFELERIASMHHAVLDADVAILNAEFFLAYPVGKNADAGPQPGLTSAMKQSVAASVEAYI
ncbi:MAG: hypothetical protein ABI612_25425 [Betaproteobacteria bacterium]